MTAGVRFSMGKSPGRPTKAEGDQGTRLIRAFDDLADMISWIVRVEGGTTAQLIDPMIRPQVVARYTKHLAVVERIKAAEEELRKTEQEARAATDKPPKRPKRG